jgi:signal transduction histidine kinase
MSTELGYQPAAIPADEPARLAELREYAILDTPPEQAFDDLTALASSIAGTPMALVSLIDDDRQWFKSRIGIDAPETPREVSFCAHAILDSRTFVVEDATLDPRFAGNPDVTGGPQIRFYAGAPLETQTGHRIGTLCVVDRKPRTLSAEDEAALRIIARQVMVQLELRKAGMALRRQSERLAAVSRMKDEFVSVVSHELRTPLTAIKGSLQLLLDGDVDDASDRQRLQVAALSNSERLIRLVNDILDISKIEAGGLQLRTQSVDPRELASTAVRSLAQFAVPVRVALTIQAQDDLPAITVDSDRIVQALVNLISNAVKFSPENAAVVVEVVRDANELRYSITDAGPGIPAESIGRLFQKFTQLDTSDARRMKGTGLGLAITKGIVEQHGGRITVRSTPGAGSTFSIHLPLT